MTPALSIVRGIVVVTASSVCLLGSVSCGTASDTVGDDADDPSPAATPTSGGAATCGTDVLIAAPFAPTDVSLFDPRIYPTSSAHPPAAPRPGDVVAVLEQDLLARVGEDAVARARELLTDPALVDVAPDLTLRAAVVSLLGTDAEPLIEIYRDGAVSTAGFGAIEPLDDGQGREVHPVALSEPAPRTFGRRVTVNARYRNEDHRLLAATMAHEALHVDDANSAKEELVANLVEMGVYVDLLTEAPEIARSPTELTQRTNGELLALLNTRAEDGRVRIFGDRGTVFPPSSQGERGSDLDSYAAAFEPLGDDTAGSEALDGVLSLTLGDPVSGAAFDTATLTALDEAPLSVSAEDLVRLAQDALGLDLGSCD